MKRKLPIVAFAVAVLFSGLGLAIAEAANSRTWTRQEFKIAGTWSIFEQNGRFHVQLSDDFKTKSAPDLKIFLSRSDLESVNGENATRDSVLVAPLKSAKGGQSFAIPEGIDLADFKTILIHCQKYSKLWGGASL